MRFHTASAHCRPWPPNQYAAVRPVRPAIRCNREIRGLVNSQFADLVTLCFTLSISRFSFHYFQGHGTEIANASKWNDTGVGCNYRETTDDERLNPFKSHMIFKKLFSRALLGDCPFVVALKRPIGSNKPLWI